MLSLFAEGEKDNGESPPNPDDTSTKEIGEMTGNED